MQYSDIEVEQQRQLLKDIEVRNKLAKFSSSSQLGMKRTHTGASHKAATKQSKGQHTTGPGQRTITSLFVKNH